MQMNLYGSLYTTLYIEYERSDQKVTKLTSCHTYITLQQNTAAKNMF
jgi:hypothetical protein